LLISRRLGHSTIAVTDDRHGHLFPDNDGKVTTNLARLVIEANAAAEVIPLKPRRSRATPHRRAGRAN
jgi:hypothetical protein